MGRAPTKSRSSVVDSSMLPTPPSTSLKVNSPPDRETFKLPEPLLSSKDVSPVQKSSTTQPKRRNHSDIERRRRIKINGKYDELRLLVPSCAGFRFAKRGGDSGLHKLDILTEAVEYIKLLQSQLNSATANQPEVEVLSPLLRRSIQHPGCVTQPENEVQATKGQYSNSKHPSGPNCFDLLATTGPMIPSPQLIALASEAEKLAPLPVPASQKTSIANLLN